MSTLLLVALALVVLAGAAYLFWPRSAPPPQLPPVLAPDESAPPKVSLPPSELEAQKRKEAEEARQRADELKAQRLELQRVAAEDAAASERAAELKAKEEDAKKEAYRAEKAAQSEEKERRRKEREEAEKAEREAALAREREAAAQEAQRKEEERAKVAAERGKTLFEGLAKTRKEGFVARLAGVFRGPARALDESVLSELEEVLFTADIGVKTATALVDRARSQLARSELADARALERSIRQEILRIVDLPVPHTLQGGGPPHVVMVVGVNGSGKTTTTGKLAAKASGEGRRVVVAAGDTFRAAAVEQLAVWADRAQATIVKGKADADPASVAFDAVKSAVEGHADLVLADTAGRLHTKVPLMDELKKVRRVIEKALPGAPHEVLLVLDSTSGQNAIAQARQFHEAIGVTGIALTKLDGTAKGGVIIGICDELKVPIVWVGVGEQVGDLRRFSPTEFVEALFAEGEAVGV